VIVHFTLLASAVVMVLLTPLAIGYFVNRSLMSKAKLFRQLWLVLVGAAIGLGILIGMMIQTTSGADIFAIAITGAAVIVVASLVLLRLSDGAKREVDDYLRV
jgi:uncharacterized protein YneF (UPF0154 family)